MPLAKITILFLQCRSNDKFQQARVYYINTLYYNDVNKIFLAFPSLKPSFQTSTSLDDLGQCFWASASYAEPSWVSNRGDLTFWKRWLYIYGHIKVPVIAATIYVCSWQVRVLSVRS